MVRDLPNLDWLRVFAVCASTQSFALAAECLGVTAGAVSQRIKALESFLGIQLFERHAKGVRLTDRGRRYAQAITPPLDQLSAATRELASDNKTGPIRITILPALAQLWLGPRLDDFHRNHANTHVEIWADPAIVDLRTSHFDIAIRYGQPPFPGCNYRPFLIDEIVPVASPDLISASGLNECGIPNGVPLNLDSFWSSDFDEWQAQTGAPRPQKLALQTFSLYSMVVEATVNGRGFMMGHTSLISDLVAQGRLAYLSEARVPTSNQFYVLTKENAPISNAALAFINWIVSV